MDRPDYRDLVATVSEVAWPEFMFHDPVADEHWGKLYQFFPAYQFALLDQQTQQIMGFANSVPLAWHTGLDELPEEGWDWALTRSVSDRLAGQPPNLLCAIQIAISPAFRRQGLSASFVQEMIGIARQSGFEALIAPVRPNNKDLYPLSSIDRYVTWKLEGGLPFDPWLRVHVRLGGRILKPCHHAMRITGDIAEWQEWSGLRFYESGPYIVPGALVPVEIDLCADLGVYVEPNVWVAHNIGIQ